MRRGNVAESAFTANVAKAVILLRERGLADVAAFLQKKEKESRKPTRRAKRKVAVRSSTGKAARGGAFWINSVDLSAGECVQQNAEEP